MSPLPEDPAPRFPRDRLEREVRITFFKSGGPGGQHKNKTATAVRLQHLPTGIIAVGQRDRSRTRNLDQAFARLQEKLVAHFHRDPPRVPTKPSRTARRKRMDEKRLQGRKKRLRAGSGTLGED